MHRALRTFVAFAVISSASTLLQSAQNTLVLNPAYTGGTIVSGKMTPGRSAITVYDVSSSPRIALGTSQSVDGRGNFAVAVSPALISGHSIMVVDQSGSKSATITVVDRPGSPSHQ